MRLAAWVKVLMDSSDSLALNRNV